MRRLFSYASAPIVAFTLVLILKYYGLQFFIFDNLNPLDCLKVAVPSLLLFTIPVEIFFRNERKKLLAYFALNAILSAAMVSVIVYFRQFGIVVTYHAFMQAHQVLDVSDSILDLLQPLYLLYFADMALYLALRLFRSAPKFSAVRPNGRALGAIWGLSAATIVAYGLFYGSLLNELKQAERMGLVSYELHTIFTGVANANAAGAGAEPITPDAVRSVKNVELPASPYGFGAAKGRNLIVVQLESYQNFLIGMKLGGKEITPNLNDLIENSYYFSNVYQSIGQGNTSDAEFIVNTGFYPPAQQAASQAYGSKKLPSLPRLLADRGYETFTLHTNEVKFWNRIQMYPALGFGRYYDMEYFGQDDIIAFGPSDEVLYDKTMPILANLKANHKPFYAHLIAQSSHHPFIPPESKEMIELPEEWEGTDIGNYVKMTNYSDRALGEFIAALKAEGLWEQSMLVVYGDHFGVSAHSLKEDDRKLLEQALGHEYDPRTVHNIPYIVTVPGFTDEGFVSEKLGGQIDFMATAANLLGISLSSHVQFGQDLLNSTDNILGSRFYLPTGSFYNDEIMYISGETFGEGTVIPLSVSDPALEADPMLYKDDFVRIMRLLQMNDAYLEALPERY
ncbi:LTA synthase family protein [Paenibacillus antri]|uniref:LTA synthase family protein n=1 Tax=Paenibacillus antri TaxID=2582848 RepID=A0A5R9G806_9BACL|nr:LTA synthase family protein [Paenibacillus antri]TLS50210.1 LTA synthase family protein [Paenibacillus antri]